jgi:hypothetical protein
VTCSRLRNERRVGDVRALAHVKPPRAFALTSAITLGLSRSASRSGGPPDHALKPDKPLKEEKSAKPEKEEKALPAKEDKKGKP